MEARPAPKGPSSLLIPHSTFLLLALLLKTAYAIPAGMYASQIWATPYLRQGKEMDNPIQKWLLKSA
eukprot:1141084-Pelagomonas_calceolata.AAC.2